MTDFYDQRDEKDRVNRTYYREGWGHYAQNVTGLEPYDVESQARTVARQAVKDIRTLYVMLLETDTVRRMDAEDRAVLEDIRIRVQGQ